MFACLLVWLFVLVAFIVVHSLFSGGGNGNGGDDSRTYHMSNLHSTNYPLVN